MEKEEIICISSGDEFESDKDKKKNLSKPAKLITECKIDNEIINDSKQNVSSQKRKSLEANDTKPVLPNLTVNKKIKMSTIENVLIAMNSMSPYIENGEKVLDKPRLVVKEKRSLTHIDQDTFPQFISLCLQKDHSKDMKIIVSKLKRRYEQLQPAQATSESFISLLNEKREAISISNKKLYVYISEVMNEMKRLCKKDKHCAQTPVINDDAEKLLTVTAPETSSPMCEDNISQGSQNRTVSKEIRMLQKCMKKCEKRIADLENEEVDFSDETNSSYMKVERYKRRMVELWHRYCKLTGENVDAGRPYLRPKHLGATRIVAVDQAITNFINSQISKNNKQPRIGASVNALIFPDYADILECIYKCNESHNLGLDKKQQQSIAKRAFTEIGQHLQLVRRNDYWDTFSLFLENKEDDPALKNAELAEKLNKNRRIGEIKLAQVFEDFVKKQDLRKNSPSSSSETEEEESGSVDGQIEDADGGECAISGEEDDSDTDTDSDSDVDVRCTDKESGMTTSEITVKKKMSISNEKSNGSKQDVGRKSTEAATMDNPVAAKKDGGVTVTVNESNNDDKKSNKSSAKLTDSKSNESSDLICETIVVENQSMTSVGSNNDAEKTSKNKTQVSESNSKETPVELRTEVLPVQSRVTVCNIAAKGTEETVGVNVSDEVKSKTCCSSKEEKPLLRVRSFAKPPTTWKDECQGTDRSNEVILNALQNPRIIIANGRKRPSDKSTSIPEKYSKKVITIKGNGNTVLRLPVLNQNERMVNGQSVPQKQTAVLATLINGNKVLPIILEKRIPIQNVKILNLDNISK